MTTRESARHLVVGNWKMHGHHATNEALLETLRTAGPLPCDVAVCPPLPYLAQAAERLARSAISWGAQDCSAHEQGAYTGEVSAAMLADFDCRYAIVGHSERRTLHHESDPLVADKAQAALAKGITPIVCVGETLAQTIGVMPLASAACALSATSGSDSWCRVRRSECPTIA